MTENALISIVTPVYSGERHLRDLIDEVASLKRDLETQHAPFQIEEMIFVDDSAIDSSPQILDALCNEYDWVSVLHLGRNFGQHPATIAGILHSCGDWVVTIDEDLQHPPQEILTLLERAVQNSADVVYAVPEKGAHRNPVRDLGSSTTKRLIATLTGNPHVRCFSSFRLMRGATARATATICNPETYFDMALCWFTNRIEAVKMDMTDRRFVDTGRSGYSFGTLLSHARRMVFTDQLKLLRAGGLFGALCAGIAALGGVLLVAWSIQSQGDALVRGWASLFLAITLFSGAIIFLLSITLEYISVLIKSVHRKPLFFVADRSGDLRLRQYFEARGNEP